MPEDEQETLSGEKEQAMTVLPESQTESSLEDLESEARVFYSVIEPGQDADTSKIKRFYPGTEKAYYADSLYRNLASRNIRTSNLDKRTIIALRLLGIVSRSEQALGNAENQTFYADIMSLVANLSAAGPPVGGTLLHLSRSKIAIERREPLKEKEEEKNKKTGWKLF